MERSPHISVTHNQQRDGAILQIDCQSDGKAERWMRNGEEAGTQGKNLWLGKLGCLLKLHQSVEGEWPY